MDDLRSEIRAAFARRQEGMGSVADARSRLLGRALEEARRPHLFAGAMAAAATIVLAGAVAIVVLLTHNHVRQAPPSPQSVEEALTSGPAAAVRAPSNQSFVWLTGDLVQPSIGGQQAGTISGIAVDVIDWSGTLRHHFVIQNVRAGLPNEIQSISPDGTRALLGDGRVLDESGRVIATISALSSQRLAANTTHWMADDRHICASFSNEVVANYPPTHPKAAPNATPTPPQPYQLPNADHSVTLKVFGLDGSVRTVATFGTGPAGAANGPFGDSTSVLSCNASADLGVVARYHDADASGGQTSNNMTVSLWAITLSTGAVLYHQPETRMALGRAFFYGSQNGKLAVEFLWNSKVWGAETDVVLRMPSGQPVPVLDAEPIPDTTGLSADGTRILRRLVDDAHQQTDLELIDAANGRIIRRVVLPGILGASAVAMPGSSSFMVQVENYLALVDSSGGVTLLHPNVTLQMPNAPGGVGLPPMPVQN